MLVTVSANNRNKWRNKPRSTATVPVQQYVWCTSYRFCTLKLNMDIAFDTVNVTRYFNVYNDGDYIMNDTYFQCKTQLDWWPHYFYLFTEHYKPNQLTTWSCEPWRFCGDRIKKKMFPGIQLRQGVRVVRCFRNRLCSLLNAGHEIQFERTDTVRKTTYVESYRNTSTSWELQQGEWLHIKSYTAANN